MHYGIQQLSNLCYRSQGINIIFVTPNLLQPYLLTTFEQYSRGLGGAIAMLSTRTWIQASPFTSGVFFL